MFVFVFCCSSFAPLLVFLCKNLTFGNAGSILDESTNTPIQSEYGVVIWCLSIFSGKVVTFDFLLLEIRS